MSSAMDIENKWEVLDVPRVAAPLDMNVAPTTPVPHNTPTEHFIPPPSGAQDYKLDVGNSKYECRPTTDINYIFSDNKVHPVAIFRDGLLEWIDQSAHLEHMLKEYDFLKKENDLLKRKNEYCVDTLDVMDKKVIQYELMYLKEKVKNYENQFNSSDEEGEYSDSEYSSCED